jgi:hypothetical protein
MEWPGFMGKCTQLHQQQQLFQSPESRRRSCGSRLTPAGRAACRCKSVLVLVTYCIIIIIRRAVCPIVNSTPLFRPSWQGGRYLAALLPSIATPPRRFINRSPSIPPPSFSYSPPSKTYHPHFNLKAFQSFQNPPHHKQQTCSSSPSPSLSASLPSPRLSPPPPSSSAPLPPSTPPPSALFSPPSHLKTLP